MLAAQLPLSPRGRSASSVKPTKANRSPVDRKVIVARCWEHKQLLFVLTEILTSRRKTLQCFLPLNNRSGPSLACKRPIYFFLIFLFVSFFFFFWPCSDSRETSIWRLSPFTKETNKAWVLVHTFFFATLRTRNLRLHTGSILEGFSGGWLLLLLLFARLRTRNLAHMHHCLFGCDFLKGE